MDFTILRALAAEAEKKPAVQVSIAVRGLELRCFQKGFNGVGVLDWGGLELAVEPLETIRSALNTIRKTAENATE